mmetsp:Transcript_21650/g.71643  ORF Transcript_21650/g.71643 Transcript_21650/m.71643 type:complete len:592 (-) Transcript_21650:148-1923(-)
MTPQTALKRERGGTSARTHRPHAPLPRHLSTRAAQQIAGRWRMPLHRSLRSRRQSSVGDRRDLRGARKGGHNPPPVRPSAGCEAASLRRRPVRVRRLHGRALLRPAGGLAALAAVLRVAEHFARRLLRRLGIVCAAVKGGGRVEPLAEEQLVGAARLEGRRGGCGGGVAPAARHRNLEEQQPPRLGAHAHAERGEGILAALALWHGRRVQVRAEHGRHRRLAGKVVALERELAPSAGRGAVPQNLGRGGVGVGEPEAGRRRVRRAQLHHFRQGRLVRLARKLARLPLAVLLLVPLGRDLHRRGVVPLHHPLLHLRKRRLCVLRREAHHAADGGVEQVGGLVCANDHPSRVALGQSRVQRGRERAAAAVGRAAGRPSAARLAVVCGDRDEGGGGVAVGLAFRRRLLCLLDRLLHLLRDRLVGRVSEAQLRAALLLVRQAVEHGGQVGERLFPSGAQKVVHRHHERRLREDRQLARVRPCAQRRQQRREGERAHAAPRLDPLDHLGFVDREARGPLRRLGLGDRRLVVLGEQLLAVKLVLHGLQLLAGALQRLFELRHGLRSRAEQLLLPLEPVHRRVQHTVQRRLGRLVGGA